MEKCDKGKIQKLAIEAIRQKIFPGCVIGYINKNGEKEVMPFGCFTYDDNSKEVGTYTTYDLASITKSIPTSMIILQLIDEKKINLNDRLVDFLPEFCNSQVTIKHLLTYTLKGYGLKTALGDIADKHYKDVIQILLKKNFTEEPGTVFDYSNVPAALMGLLIEKVENRSLLSSANRRFFQPLGMTRTFFSTDMYDKDNFPPTETDDYRGMVQGIVHDESAYVCFRDGRTMGHAGLFSCAPDILRFFEMILNDGEWHGKKFFSEGSMKQMETNQIPELNGFVGLGWELNQPRFMGDNCTEHTFGKTGFTGTICVCDRDKGVAYVILSNRTYPKRPADSSEINGFRKAIGDIFLK